MIGSIIRYMLWLPLHFSSDDEDGEDYNFKRYKNIIYIGSFVLFILGILGYYLIVNNYSMDGFLYFISSIFGLYFCLQLFLISQFLTFNEKMYLIPIGIILSILRFFLTCGLLYTIGQNILDLPSDGGGRGFYRIRL